MEPVSHAPRLSLPLIIILFFLETYHNGNSLYVKLLQFYLIWINSKKLRRPIIRWSRKSI